MINGVGGRLLNVIEIISIISREWERIMEWSVRGLMLILKWDIDALFLKLFNLYILWGWWKNLITRGGY